MTELFHVGEEVLVVDNYVCSRDPCYDAEENPALCIGSEGVIISGDGEVFLVSKNPNYTTHHCPFCCNYQRRDLEHIKKTTHY